VGKRKDTNSPPPQQPVHLDDLVLIADSANEGMSISVRVDKPRLNAYVCLEYSDPSASVSAEEIEKVVAQGEIQLTPEIRANIRSLPEQAQSAGAGARTFLLATGTPSEDGLDGKIVWRVPYLDKPTAKLTDDGRMDYRELGNIINVTEEQRILEVHPPTAGRMGTDVFGQPIQALPGKPIRIRGGKGVRVSEDGGTFYAATVGRVIFDSGLLMVEPVLEVAGDVDYSVGNIDFNGPVKVMKNVLDGFSVKATGPIEIVGHVEAAYVESRADIIIHGGVNGKMRGKVKAGGSLSVRYLNEADVEAEANVLVEKSITKSSVRCRGDLFVENGAVKGGQITALGNMTVSCLGSEAGVVTEVTVGVEYKLADELAAIDRDIAEVEEQRQRIVAGIGPLLDDPSKRYALAAESREAVDRLARQAEQYRLRIEELDRKREAITARLSEARKSKIAVTRKLEAGVVARIGACSRRIDEPLQGPLELVPDISDGSLVVHQARK